MIRTSALDVLWTSTRQLLCLDARLRSTRVRLLSVAFLFQCASLFAQGDSPTDGLISYWSFENSIDDVGQSYTADSGSSDDNLMPQGGAVRYGAGQVGQALAIGVQVGDLLWLDAASSEDVDLGPIYSIEAWVFPTELADSWQRLVLRWGGVGINSYHFAIKNNGGDINAVSLFHGESSDANPNANGGTVVLNEWQHIAGVADGEMLRVYLNGIEVGSAPYDGTIAEGTDEPLGIGDSATQLSTIRYNGWLDEVAIWDVALTPDEILSHYEAGEEGYGLEAVGGCDELRDGVSIDAPRVVDVDEAVTLTATATGIDPGAEATWQWELVSGEADLGATDGPTLEFSSSVTGDLVFSVSVGDGVCDDTASAEVLITVIDPGELPDPGLVAFYDFDDSTDDNADLFAENVGTALDSLSSGLGVEPRFVEGQVGGAVAIGVEVGDVEWLDGELSEDLDLAPVYTIETWIYPTELDDSWQRLIVRWGAAGQSYHLAIRNNGTGADGQPNVNAVSLFHNQQISGNVNADGGTVVLETWQHIAGVADGEMLRVYLDGEEVAAVPYDGTIARPEGQALGVGDFFGGNGLRYNGLLDELAIWNYALDGDTIREHFEAGPDGYGLERGCLEERDQLSVEGPATALTTAAVELSAQLTGVDPGGSESYSWEIVSGAAELSATDTATVRLTASDVGIVEVRVEGGDGRCTDTATATHRVQFFTGGQGSSPDEGLISYWSFDEELADEAENFDSSSGEVLDDLTPGAGTAAFVPGVVGNALSIGSGAGDVIWLQAPDSVDVDLGPIYSIEAWIFPTELSTDWQRLVLRWGGTFSYHLAIRNNSGFVNAVSLFHGQEDGGQPNANGGTVILRTWQHVAGVADGEFLRVYLDGVEVDAVPYDGTMAQTGGEFGEGFGIADNFNGGSTISYNGLLDEVAIWNVALTPEEIRSHADAGPSGYGLDGGGGGRRFHRADPNDDGITNLTDGVAVLDFLFRGGVTPTCLESADANDDGEISLTDGVVILSFLFQGGAPPAAPGAPPAACGTDPVDSPADLGCDTYTSC